MMVRVFERFTERARQAVVLAQEEVRALGHDSIGTEHVLLGLLRVEEGLAARVLDSFGVAIEDVREEVVRRAGRGESPATGQIPFTPEAKETLELALREALALGHNYIGTEHVLLGLLRADQGPALEILRDLGVGHEAVREQVIGLVAREQPRNPPRITRRRRRTWEYIVVPLEGGITEELLAPLGRAGWELVTVVGEQGDLRAVFKRPA